MAIIIRSEAKSALSLEGQKMAVKLDRKHYPLWVKLSLWGLPNKGSVWAFVGLSIFCAVASVAYAVMAGDLRFYAGLLFLLAALMYWLAIRWVDNHGSWDDVRSNKA
jgi:hypothetical protein